jgi:hypothetical protein
MKNIERSDRKTKISPWRLGGRKTCDADEGRGSHGGGEPWGASLLTLEALVTGEENLGEGATSWRVVCVRETVWGFKYPWTRTLLDIVQHSRTLSGQNSLSGLRQQTQSF